MRRRRGRRISCGEEVDEISAAAPEAPLAPSERVRRYSRVLVREMWASLAIISMWLAVLFDAPPCLQAVGRPLGSISLSKDSRPDSSNRAQSSCTSSLRSTI